MTPEEEIIRAERVKQVLEDPYVKAALNEIREAIVSQWAKAPIKDKDHKEKMWDLYNAVDKFEELLRIHIESGKVASHSLREKRSYMDWLR